MDYLALLTAKYGYFVLFPISIFEGPIVTIVAGFLVSLGLLNFFIVYIIVIVGDFIGDVAYYVAGRWGARFFENYLKKHEGKIEQAKEYFSVHHNKALVISKLIQGIGAAGLFVAGSLKIPFGRYARLCFLISAIQYAVFLVIGALFGGAYLQINKYLNYYAAITSIVALSAILIFILYKLKIWKRG